MSHIVLGTAGHVDHGKTTLVKALTGIDTDRLKEEKERGITIELGFASLSLGNGQRLGIVDVPGHEKFINNMVAGASGLDLVALIIAADEGVMPQTREHLEVCTLLGIKTGLVVLTKTDLVDKQWLELVQEDIREFLKGTFLESAPIIPVSAPTGNGLPELITALQCLTATLSKTDASGFFRLPVDRVFTMKGFGTVVTGTTISGKVSTGDEIEILPGKIKARIRGIQVYNEPSESAQSGQRTALNLQGIDKDAVKKGHLITQPGLLIPSLRIDVFYHHLPSAPSKLKNRSLIRFHSGTAELMGRIILLDRDEISPNESAFAQIVFESSSVTMSGDRFVIRSYSPVKTIGGGSVLDPYPQKHKRFLMDVQNQMERLLTGSDSERIQTIIERAGVSGIHLDQLSVRTGIAVNILQIYLDQMQSVKHTVMFDKEDQRVILLLFYRNLQDAIIRGIREHQEKFPLKIGVSKEELKSSWGSHLDSRLFNLLIRDLEREGKLLLEKDTIRTPDHIPQLQAESEGIRQKIEEIYLNAALTVPSSKNLSTLLGEKDATLIKNILKLMLKEGTLIKITEDMYLHGDIFSRLREDYRRLLLKEGKSTTSDFKNLTGLSRKYVIPLMEYFDAVKLTIRIGDLRVLRKSSGSEVPNRHSPELKP